MMKRRAVIALLGAAGSWSLVARGQQPALPLIAWLGNGAPTPRDLATFERALDDAGFVKGRTVAIEYVDGRATQLADLAADLVRRKPGVLIANSTSPALAAKAATATVPIVFAVGGDAVKFGLVADRERPGGNATGVNVSDNPMGAKRLALLHEMVPRAALIAVILNPRNASFDAELHDVEQGARSIAQQILALRASTERDLDAAFATLAERRAGAAMIAADPFLGSRRAQVIALSTRHAVPTMATRRDFVEAGGLMSYGPSSTELHTQLGVYAARILKGEKPADLPVFSSTSFEFVIHVGAAKAFGLEIPPQLRAFADELVG